MSEITILQLHCMKQAKRSLSSDDISRDSADDVYMKIYPDGNFDQRWLEDDETNMETDDYVDVGISVTYESYLRVEVFDHDSLSHDELLGVMKIDKPSSPDFNETVWIEGENGEDGAKYELSYQFTN